MDKNGRITMTIEEKYDSPIINWVEKQGISLEDIKEETSYRFKSPGMMDLIVGINRKDEKVLDVSISHVGEQMGDLMYDPEIVYLVDTGTGKVVPVYYKNDYMGEVKQGRKLVDGKTVTDDAVTADLISFTETWAENINAMGYEVKETV